MKKNAFLLYNFVICWLLFSAFAFSQEKNFYDQSLISIQDEISYLVSLPSDYQSTEQNYPVILFLHGGDRSNTKHHPKKYWLQSELSVPCIVIAPQAQGRLGWHNANFRTLLKEVSVLFRINTKRIYITGYSYGGYGTWTAISKYPDLFAAAAPICGGGDSSNICVAKTVAVKAFHAIDDPVTPYSKSEKMVRALKACNGNAELKTAKTGGHGIWPYIYRDPEFYAWLLKNVK